MTKKYGAEMKQDYSNHKQANFQLQTKLQADLAEKISEQKVPFEGIIYLLFLNRKTHSVYSALEMYILTTRNIKLLVNGKDVMKEGFASGKQVGEILKATLRAKIDGSLLRSSDPTEQKKIEIEWIRKHTNK